MPEGHASVPLSTVGLLIAALGLLIFRPVPDWTAVLTGATAVAAFIQIAVLGIQTKRLRQTIESCERGSTPFLHPLVKCGGLYPAKTLSNPGSQLAISFSNLGKTPATMRRVGVRLYLVDDAC